MKSQWEFEFAPSEQPARKVFSVSELTGQVRGLLEKELSRVWVSGEITNLRVQSSGHIYFTLKDATAQLRCVLFRGEYQADRSLLQDGRMVTLQGGVTVYEARGEYQLRVTYIEPQGIGALQVAFEKLKQKLAAEGLFAQERKRPLPRFPERIGVVTSATGAAIRDVLHVVRRRNPGLDLVLAPCRVQGPGAGEEIAAAIRLLNEYSAAQAAAGRKQAALDLVLVTRGGGSLEDLWAFNEEGVARAIFESALPVVSAVGHEIDFTISDFVADLRAATPSAAAEILTEGVVSSSKFISQAETRMAQLVQQHLEDKRYVLSQTGQRLGRLHPRRRLNDWFQRLDDLQSALRKRARAGLRDSLVRCDTLAQRLARVRPWLVISQKKDVLCQTERRLHEQARHRVRLMQDRLASLRARLGLLGPEQVLARGYSITVDAETREVLRDPYELRQGQRLLTHLQKGEVLSRVQKPKEKVTRPSNS